MLIEARGCVVNRGSRAGLEESEALRRSSFFTTHPAMFGFAGGEGDDGDDDVGDGDDVDIVPSTFTVVVLAAEGRGDNASIPEDATILDTR